jgi:hypothetical protein
MTMVEPLILSTTWGKMVDHADQRGGEYGTERLREHPDLLFERLLKGFDGIACQAVIQIAASHTLDQEKCHSYD